MFGRYQGGGGAVCVDSRAGASNPLRHPSSPTPQPPTHAPTHLRADEGLVQQRGGGGVERPHAVLLAAAGGGVKVHAVLHPDGGVHQGEEGGGDAGYEMMVGGLGSVVRGGWWGRGMVWWGGGVGRRGVMGYGGLGWVDGWMDGWMDGIAPSAVPTHSKTSREEMTARVSELTVQRVDTRTSRHWSPQKHKNTSLLCFA